MIPPKTFRAIVFSTTIAWYFGAVPFKFVTNRNGVKTIKASFTKARTVFVYSCFAVSSFYMFFIAFRAFQKVALESEQASQDFIVKMGYLILSYLMPVVLQINTLLMWEELPRLVSSYLTFFREVKECYILPGERGPKCIKFFSAVLTIGMLAHVWTYIFHVYAYISCLVFIVRELDPNVKKPRTRDIFRQPKVFTKTIRSLHMLHRLWQHAHQSWFCPSHKAVTISIGTLASYGVIKLRGPRSLVMGCMATLSLLYLWTLFRKFGQLHELSDQMLENWKHSTSTTKWMRKFVHSVPVLRVDIGSFYHVEKTTVITVLWTVLNNTITLLFL
ncbi:unnamed protein product [Orchesella dallaii]|uniref:Gustatory receptor n=1 Tax=Orchesella dallaii TaxID=48710 RepID=A0ABP1PQ99_9HEXA